MHLVRLGPHKEDPALCPYGCDGCTKRGPFPNKQTNKHLVRLKYSKISTVQIVRLTLIFFAKFIVLTMTTAAMYSMSINSLDIWERVTLGLPKIWTTDPLPMIPHQVQTQFIASQPFPVSVSGIIPSLSAAPGPCWFRKCPNPAMVTQTVQEYPHQLASKTQGLHDTPRSQHTHDSARQDNMFLWFEEEDKFSFQAGKYKLQLLVSLPLSI